MRLAALEPKWVTPFNWASEHPYYIGLTFYCPHCDPSLPEHGPNRRRRLAVSFWPHIDPANVAATFGAPWPRPTEAWNRVAGDTFDTLTLTPSVDVSQHGHWHGFIKNGEIR